MDLLQAVAAALIAAGSALVIRAVWLADLEPESPRTEPLAQAPPEIETEWREAA